MRWASLTQRRQWAFCGGNMAWWNARGDRAIDAEPDGRVMPWACHSRSTARINFAPGARATARAMTMDLDGGEPLPWWPCAWMRRLGVLAWPLSRTNIGSDDLPMLKEKTSPRQPLEDPVTSCASLCTPSFERGGNNEWPLSIALSATASPDQHHQTQEATTTFPDGHSRNILMASRPHRGGASFAESNRSQPEQWAQLRIPSDQSLP